MPDIPPFTRRAFLQSAAAVAAVGITTSPVHALASAAAPAADRLGVLVDLTRCIGCRACVRACDDRNDLPGGSEPATTVWDGPAQALVYDRWTAVNLVKGSEDAAPVSVKQQCLHCLEPACASVCPVGALERQSNGAVIWKAERCIGCRYCVFACPFGIPKFQWDSGASPVIGKCQFCAQHAVFTGPACASACPTGALKFGKREELLFEANARMHARPDRYIDHVYGEQEAGGTAWLYLSGQSFERLGFPSRLPRVPLPSLTWMALKVIPAIVTVLVASLTIISLRVRSRSHA